MKKIIETFNQMSLQEILEKKPGQWGDYELLDVISEYEEQDEIERMMAVYEMILRSPEVSEMVDYGELYEELVEFYISSKDYLNAVRWILAGLVYIEKHVSGENRMYFGIRLADTYIQLGELELGIACYTAFLQSYPRTAWLYYSMGRELANAGLFSLGIEVLDMGLNALTKENREVLNKDISDARRDTMEEMTETTDRSSEVEPSIINELRTTLKWAESQSVESEESEPYPALLTRLIQADSNQQTSIKEPILERGKMFIPGLIRLAFDLEQTSASVQAIAILRKIAKTCPDEFTLLQEWLDQAEGDWLTNLFTPTMGKVKGYTTLELQEVAADCNYDFDVRLSALEALEYRVEKFSEQKDGVVAFLCGLLERFEAYLAEEEEANAWIIDNLLKMDARQAYPYIRKAFDEDRVHPEVIALSDIHEKWGLEKLNEEPLREGMYLPLKCKKCRRTRVHYVDYVIIEGGTMDRYLEEKETPFDAHIMDHPIVCPKCSAIDSYELTFQSRAQIMGPDILDFLFEQDSNTRSSKKRENPRVFYTRTSIFGKEMHPLEGLEEYRHRIALDPTNAELYVRMGNLLRSILRYEQALVAHRQAVELAPDDPEVLVAAAYSEQDMGDTEVAEQHYQKIIKMDISNMKSTYKISNEVLATAVEGLNALRKGQWSPNDLYFSTRTGKKVTHPSNTLKKLKPFHPQPNLLNPQFKKKTKRGHRKKK